MVKLIENDEHFILVSLLITVCMQMSFFAIAYTLKWNNSSDPTPKYQDVSRRLFYWTLACTAT